MLFWVLAGALVSGLLIPGLGVQRSATGLGIVLGMEAVQRVQAFPNLESSTGVSRSPPKTDLGSGTDDEHDVLGLLEKGSGSLSTKNQNCTDYSTFSQHKNGSPSSGKYALPLQRPAPECRTFNSSDVEALIAKMKKVISDPDLFRLFENTFPNTLDTAIRAKRTVPLTGEELTFVITGDINAMWLRDSANQLQSYLSLVKPSKDPNSLASLYRGVINLHSRYLTLLPYCNSFQPPKEVDVPVTINVGASTDLVDPAPNAEIAWECKFELDSLAAFLQVSSEYYQATKDAEFFGKFNWVQAVETVLKTAEAMTTPTYGPDGSPLRSPYVFQRQTSTATETLSNNGIGNPVGNGTGMIRSAFRPSDDATIYQLFVPANMMFARYLASAAEIMATVPNQSATAKHMKNLANQVKEGIQKNGIIDHPRFGKIYAYEIDGFGSYNLMDDANIPSLLAAPMIGFLDKNDPVYLNTRKFVLSRSNPYFMSGPVISSVGGPHIGPGMAWPMASIVRILTTDNDEEIYKVLKEIVSSTDGLGLIHESINSFSASKWTRQWFSWANGLFGQMILDLADRKPELLKRSYQP